MASRSLVCFAGMDGSGKSTIINLYKQHLAEREQSVESYWWLEGENNAFRNLGKALYTFRNKGSIEHPVNMGTSNGNRVTLIKKIYINAVVTESLLFGIRILYLKSLRKKSTILLLDRYYYDTIFALSKEFQLPETWINRYLGIFQFLLPSPDIVVYITIPPETAFLRKPEEFVSLEEAKEKSKEYEKFRDLIMNNFTGDFIEFENTSSLDSIEALFRDLDEKCALL